jgi:hypothetical protein
LSKRFGILLSVLFVSTLCAAQANEIGVLAGGMFTSDKTLGAVPSPCPSSGCAASTVHTPTRISYEGIVAHRVLNAHIAAVHFELPIIGIPTRTLEVGLSSQNFSTVFVTPGFRLSASLPFLSPFVSAGGGFAHYSSTGSSSTVAAFQVGGGVDLSTPLPLIGFRAEVREFHTGTPNFSVGNNNIFAGAGLVLKF